MDCDMLDSTSSSSESDDEELAKLRSVAVDVSFIKPKEEEPDGDKSSKSALFRAKPPNDEHFLNVTPEFQQHIGKKLKESLDASITLTPIWAYHEVQEESKSDFRLFSESVPGSDFTSRDNYVQRRRRRSSTSSDEEIKLAESAVSVEDIQKQRELLFPNKLTRGKVEEILPAKKKKKKKKVKGLKEGEKDQERENSLNGTDIQSKQRLKKKKKKSKSKDNESTNTSKDERICDEKLTKSMKKRMRLKKLQEVKVGV